MSLITRLDNGGPLTLEQMDNNLLYLQDLAISGGGSGSSIGQTGPTGSNGATGPTGPAGSGSVISGTYGTIPMLNQTLNGYTASVLIEEIDGVHVNKPLYVDSLIDGKSGLYVNRLKPIDFIIASASFVIQSDMGGSTMASMTVTNTGIIYGVNSSYDLVKIENIVSSGGVNGTLTLDLTTFDPNYTSGPLGTIYADEYSQVIWFLQDDGQFINLVKMSMSDNSNQEIITFNAEVTADFRFSSLSDSVDFIATQNELYICSRYDGNSSASNYVYNSNNTKIWKLNKSNNTITFLAVAEMVYKNQCTSAVLSNGFIYVPCFMGSSSDILKINITNGVSTRYNINRNGFNAPLNTIGVDPNGNIYVVSLQYNSEIIKFDPQTEQISLYFKNYTDDQGNANSLMSNGAFSMVYNTDANLFMLTDKSYTGVYYIKETTDNTIPALNNFYYFMPVSGNSNSKYAITNSFITYGADYYSLYRVTIDIPSIGIGVDKNGEVVEYVAPPPVIPPSNWNSTSGQTQILNKPTKLSEFTDDLIIEWPRLHGDQKKIGLIDFDYDNKGIFVDKLTVTSSVVSNISSYGFRYVKYCDDRFIAIYVDSDTETYTDGIDFYMSYDGESWSKLGDRLILTPSSSATSIRGYNYVNGKLVISTSYTTGFGSTTATILYYSNDKGLNWQTQNVTVGSLNLEGGFTNILYVNGNYILSGYFDAAYFTSTDFINWTPVIISGGIGTNGITYFNGNYYKQSTSSGNNTGIPSFEYSSNLNSWTTLSLGLSPSTPNLVGTGWFIIEDTLYNFCYQRPGSGGMGDEFYVLKTTNGINFTLDKPYDIDNPLSTDNNFFYGQINPTGYVNGYFIQVIGPLSGTAYSKLGYIYSKDGIGWKFKETTAGASVYSDIRFVTVGNNRLVSGGSIYTDIYTYNQSDVLKSEIFTLFIDDSINFVNNVNDFQINGLSILPEEKILDIKLQGYYVLGTDVLRMDKYVGVTVSATYSVDWFVDKHHVVMTGNTVVSQVNNIPDGYSKTINIFVSGNFTLTLPSVWTTNLSGTYSTTKLNKITVDYIRPNLYWTKIEN